ncbi:MAG: lipoyl synthase [Deltaproteobacteria bacterium]|nr:lipoyl synthase [Deltaproteobacteria bacterium]MBW2140292.1 lipoyl synthase [Deltaproteobacteria bacterium]
MTRRTPKPRWLSRKIPSPGLSSRVSGLLKDLSLHTVCQEAICPNQGECFGHGTATFLLLGPNCTRNCAFCAVKKERVVPPQETEPDRIAQAVSRMDLKFCVLTMVTRDDLPGGGAEHVANTIFALRNRCPDVGVEVLISDFGGSETALMTVLETQPEVLNHNIETVSRLYPEVRPQADYRRSLELLARADSYRPKLVTKSGMMLGLGETRDEVLEAMDGLRAAGCDLLTLGQYLCPSEKHHPVARYVPPEEFDELKTEALKKGFTDVASGPYVRSSYKAEDLFKRALAAWS